MIPMWVNPLAPPPLKTRPTFWAQTVGMNNHIVINTKSIFLITQIKQLKYLSFSVQIYAILSNLSIFWRPFYDEKRALQHVLVLNALSLIYVINKGAVLNQLNTTLHEVVQSFTF